MLLQCGRTVNQIWNYVTNDNYDAYKNDDYDTPTRMTTTSTPADTTTTTTFNPITPSNTQTTMSVTVMLLNLCVPPSSYTPKTKSNQPPLNQPSTISSSSNSRQIPMKPRLRLLKPTTNQRRPIIAGSAVGFVVLLLLLIGVFYHRRRKNKKFGCMLRGGDESFKMGHVRGRLVGQDRIEICRTLE